MILKKAPNIHCSIIHKSQKVEATQCPSMAPCINKIWFIHTME